MEDDLKKNEMEDDLNFKAVLLSLFNNKNLKTNGFDTIEIDLVKGQKCRRVLQFCQAQPNPSSSWAELALTRSISMVSKPFFF